MTMFTGRCGRWLLMAVLWAAQPNLAWAQKPENINPGELALLPPYCADSMGFRPANETEEKNAGAMRWIGLMGPSFRHIHHHCWSLINERRAKAPGAAGHYREGLLARVITDNLYVIQNSPPNFIMLPDVYLKIGDAQVSLKRFELAFEAYSESIRRKPDYWRPYGQWAQAMVLAGNPKGALGILEEGLRRASNQGPLREQYKRLGGNLDKFLKTLPPPTARPASAPASAAAPEPASAPAPSSAPAG